MMQQQLDKPMIDSVYVDNTQWCFGNPIVQSGSWVDTLLAIAMAVIAITDVVLTYHIFIKNRKASSESEYKARKFELMQVLILDSNIHKFYKFFDDVTAECIKLKLDSNQTTKEAVNKEIISFLKLFRLEFITLVKVIDDSLYDKMKISADQLIDGITEAIFDPGINLNYDPKYDEVVTQRISKCRTDCLIMLLQIAKEGIE